MSQAQKATLVLDLGNSETRGIVFYGKDSNGRLNESSFILSNHFANVNDNFTLPTDYDEKTSTVFKISARVSDRIVQGTFINGEVQLKEADSSPIRPTATEKKYNADTTALSLVVSFLQGYREIAKMTKVSNLADLNIDWNVVVLIPPGDLDIGKVKIVDIIKSINVLECIAPKLTIPIKCSKTMVLPEGFCAYIGTVQTRGKKMRNETKYLIKEKTLVFDIGAGTSDILVISDAKVIDKSRYTINRGGNNVLQYVRKQLRSQEIILSESEVAQGIITGYVRDGSRTLDISDIVNEAKAETAKRLVADVKVFFEETEIPARSISKILMCGGGAMGSPNNNIRVLGDIIIEYFKQISPYVELVTLPDNDVVTMVDGVRTVTKKPISPRELNILGASILGELFMQ